MDLSLVNAIGAAKIHITEDGILDLLVYPVGSDTVILYASEDQGLTWSDPIFRERVEFPGVLPVSDQFSDQGSDLEFIRVSRPPSTQPYGPDSLFYGHIEQINSQSVGISHHASSVDRLLVHPNPFSGSVAIDCLLARSGRLNVRVFDIQGQLLTERIYSGTLGENRILMELGHLRQGTYLIEVIGSDRSGNQGYRSTVRLMKL